MELRYTAKERKRRAAAQELQNKPNATSEELERAARTLKGIKTSAEKRTLAKAVKAGEAEEPAFKSLFPGDYEDPKRPGQPRLKLVDRLTGSLEQAVRLGLLKGARDPRVDAYWLGLGFTEEELYGPGDPDLQKQLDAIAAMPGDREAGVRYE